MSDYVTFQQLAERLHIDRTHVRKVAKKNGFNIVKVRTAESRMQMVDALTKEDADTLIELREAQGFPTDEHVAESATIPIENGGGVFYIVAVVPELAPNRVKVGFTNDIDGRLAAHRTAAPTATTVKVWPCKRTWEIAAIDSITREGCRLIANEVYESDNLDGMIQHGDAFFALMPVL